MKLSKNNLKWRDFMKRAIMVALAMMLLASAPACVALNVVTGTPAAETSIHATETSIHEHPPALTSEETQDDNVKTYKVGVCIYSFDSGPMPLFYEEIERYFRSLETDAVKYDVTVVDGWRDNDRQIRQVEDFIERGVDVMIVDLVKASSASLVTQMADNAGVPVVYMADEPSAEDMYASNNICYVGVDMRHGGTVQGEIVANLPDRGDINGDGVVSYVMIMGDPAYVRTHHVTEYSIKALTDAGITVEELVSEYAYLYSQKAHEIAAKALNEYGKRIDVIFCSSDMMAGGAHAAIEAAGRKVGEDIYLVGTDGVPEALSYINRGEMTGTASEDYCAQGRAAAEAALNYLEGRGNDKYIFIDYVPVTKGSPRPGW